MLKSVNRQKLVLNFLFAQYFFASAAFWYHARFERQRDEAIKQPRRQCARQHEGHKH